MEICIIAGLTAWHRGHDPPQIDTIVPMASNKLLLSYSKQTKIGWGHSSEADYL